MSARTAPIVGDDADDDIRARAAAQRFDQSLHALAAPLSNGLSPIALTLAFADWALHLATQPAQAARLAAKAQQQAWQGWSQALSPNPDSESDPRFRASAWQAWPWPVAVAMQHAAEAWWADASVLRGMSPHDQQMTRFFAGQWLDLMAPANLGWLSPEVRQRTRERLGANLAQGGAHAIDEWRRRHGLEPRQKPDHRYQPGADVATTPGRVVHRNHLVELIQYLPSTPQVRAEPVFIVPSWIMKYYILDLSPHDSLVRWLVAQGHTVFILSWRNPDETDALLSMDDYLELGVFDALAAIARLLPDQPVHACGYCLGGTLLAIAAAALARPRAVARAGQLPALSSVTLLAAETDFSEPGELGVLIDESQVTMLEDLMAERGYLSGAQMAGSFAYLHARDLFWAQRLRAFWLGEADAPNDLMAWNADTTRMPALMHSQYLRRCYLGNQLAAGSYPVEGRPVSLTDIRQPLFVVGTEKDHVSPWTSVYKIHHLCEAEVTFVLASGGHNAGIVSEPGHAGRHHALALREANAASVDAAGWQALATRADGSWWPAWHHWLAARGSGRSVAADTRVPDAKLAQAPGRYVLQRYAD